eukprot:6009758-Prorocentrum_lima.AAC.1
MTPNADMWRLRAPFGCNRLAHPASRSPSLAAFRLALPALRSSRCPRLSIPATANEFPGRWGLLC